jgi:hypothetical protein
MWHCLLGSDSRQPGSRLLLAWVSGQATPVARSLAHTNDLACVCRSFRKGGEIDKAMASPYGDEILLDCSVVEVGKAVVTTTRWVRAGAWMIGESDASKT